ncbi:KR domain-containing protein [Streptomyces sp. H-KF8]|uniref:KR domain-containing protein n=1 Tax=Streptomyces sp. H-KF8 TaxID=1727216 RepID=UPI0013319ABE
MTGVWGGTGAAVRSAASARMDALAAHRHSLGLPATSVSWGRGRRAGRTPPPRATGCAPWTPARPGPP